MTVTGRLTFIVLSTSVCTNKGRVEWSVGVVSRVICLVVWQYSWWTLVHDGSLPTWWPRWKYKCSRLAYLQVVSICFDLSIIFLSNVIRSIVLWKLIHILLTRVILITILYKRWCEGQTLLTQFSIKCIKCNFTLYLRIHIHLL